MKLVTKIAVSFNDGIVGQTTGIVEGTLNNCNQSLRFEFDSNFNFEYKTVEGKNITSNSFSLSESEANVLYEEVKGLLPTGLNYTEQTTYLYYLGMRVKMAETFGILTSDIDIL